MTPQFRISQGDLPEITDTLQDDFGPVDLTAGTVQFSLQGNGVSFTRNAEVVAAEQGQVKYQMAAGDTDVPGFYEMQWTFTEEGVPRTFPTTPITFEIVARVPVAEVSGVTAIADTFELMRALLGDFKKRRYEDEALASVVRSCIRMGKVPGYRITANNRFIEPAIASPRELALLVLNGAKMMVMPNAAAYSYRLRSMSESFGEQKLFLFDLETQLADAEGGRVFYTFQSFYGWVAGTAGVNVWALMTDMNVLAPVGRVTIGVGGVQVTAVG